MIFQTITDSFLSELVRGEHDFSSDVFKLALYSSNSNLDNTTESYSAFGECVGSGYTAGGIVVNASIVSGAYGSVLIDFDDVTFSSVSITARAGLIYNSSKSDKSVLVMDFGLDISRSGGDLVVRFPEADDQNAMIRICR